MQPNRSQLDILKDAALGGAQLDVAWNADRRRYTLQSLIGEGQTAVAWRATDTMNRPYAIKFALRADYATHSLEAEALRVHSLTSRLFARIEFFGEPCLPMHNIDCSNYYALVVEWVDGDTLSAFLARSTTEIDPGLFSRLARDLCEALELLRQRGLTHNDLHDKNIIVRPVKDPLLGDSTVQLVVIDTGQLKTEARRNELVDLWQQQADLLETVVTDTQEKAGTELRRLRRLADYFSRTDQEWIVHHLCLLYNRLRVCLASSDSATKRFIRDLPSLFRMMVDSDVSRRIDDPRQMYREIESLWTRSSEASMPSMSSPFDLPSAELIRSDQQLMALFSDEYPRLDSCRSNAPVYLYGPRGCGKSTVLRSLSLKALLASSNPAEELAKIPFIGVFVSSSAELRSRFWLMRDEDFDLLEGHLVRYFNLLLLDSLVDTLDCVLQSDLGRKSTFCFDMTEARAAECAEAIRRRLRLDAEEARYAGTSQFAVLKGQIRRARDDLWMRILDRTQSAERPDAQLIFDVCQDLEEIWAFLKIKRLAFLIDDYSSQRIPVGLQKKLNQAITFSKQGSPIFKVTSEYNGVDLEGVQEGREVNEVNIGFEYVNLQGGRRYRFLQSVIERRFNYLNAPLDLLMVLPLSNVEPATAMARAIREAVIAGRKFHYHGLDTISDVCSGDFATGIDLVRRIFENARMNWRQPRLVPPQVQDRAIREFADHEFEYIRYQARHGRQKYAVAERLCWLSKECVLKKDTEKDGEIIPVVKNHLDIADGALRELEKLYPDNGALLEDLIRRGILFPLQASRSREAHSVTQRFMIRRILLARYTSALGRHTPVRIDDVQRLNFLLTDPKDFVKDELDRTSASREQRPEPREDSADAQMRLQFPNAE